MTSEDRARVGRAWLEMGIGEHASVAAFARFILHLMSLGAPPDLLLDAIQAMKDEVQHARLCFGIAMRLTGDAAGPGRMDLSRIFEQGDDPASILEAAIIEGCINETISAICARAALDRAEDSTIRAVLTRIVEDESRHADLAWRFVGWMLETYPALTATAQACFAAALSAPAADSEEEENTLLERYGHLLPSSKRRVMEAALHDVIVPRVDALFGRSTVHPGRKPIAEAGVRGLD
jgi:hypothetical protein